MSNAEKKEKWVLLCVVPGEIYVDKRMRTWYPFDGASGGNCLICDEGFDGENGFASSCEKFQVHETCVRETLPSEMFSHFDRYHSVQHLMSRFSDILGNMQVEFLMHMEKKGDSWKDCPMSNLLWTLMRVYSKFILGMDDLEVGYDELIDLALMCLMVGTRYREELEK